MYAEASNGKYETRAAMGGPAPATDVPATPELQLILKRMVGANEQLRSAAYRLTGFRDRMHGAGPESGDAKGRLNGNGIIWELNNQISDASDTAMMLAELAGTFERIA